MTGEDPALPDAAKPTVALIGAGRAGVALAAAFSLAGHGLVAVSSRTPGALTRVKPWLADGADPAELGAPEALLAAEITLIAVPDDALASLAAALGEHGLDLTGRTAIHVSGRLGPAVLAPLAARGAATLAIHPAMAFAGDVAADLRRIAGARFAVTAARAADLARGDVLVRGLGGVPFAVAEADRPLYHAALAHGSNHLATLVLQAGAMLGQAHVEPSAEVLRPLLQAALDNALMRGPAGATGPVVRGDADTVREHLEAIRARLPEASAAYREMSRAGVRIARAGGRITDAQAERLMEALDQGAPPPAHPGGSDP